MIQFEVGADRSVEGYGELWYSRASERSLMFTIDISGSINPNSSLDCRYELDWVYPGLSPQAFFPSDSIGRGKISGFLNPSLDYGQGFVLSKKEEVGYFFWMVHRQGQ